jgi:hypothetical protein
MTRSAVRAGSVLAHLSVDAIVCVSTISAFEQIQVAIINESIAFNRLERSNNHLNGA